MQEAGEYPRPARRNSEGRQQTAFTTEPTERTEEHEESCVFHSVRSVRSVGSVVKVFCLLQSDFAKSSSVREISKHRTTEERRTESKPDYRTLI
jgi:hypothetical protein